jgi:hypothetical protein
LIWVFVLLALLLGVFLGSTGKLTFLAAEAADILRGIFGNRVVAWMETLAFETQDFFRQWSYRLGFSRPAAPWAGGLSPVPSPSKVLSITPPTKPTRTVVIPSRTPKRQNTQAGGTARTVTPPVSPTPSQAATVTADGWTLSRSSPFGDLQGEGEWAPYLYDQSGKVVAYRTFFQPDPDRPYAFVGAVALNLKLVRLGFVLGTEEPADSSSDLHKRDGMIPYADRQPGKLLATFNGGFKTAHGKFGAMAFGVSALPAQTGLATVVIYPDGRVKIGQWGRDVDDSLPMRAWRQNGPLILDNGEITPKVYTNLIKDWGGTLDGEVVTWRSALGISEDEQTLYYFAGPSLSMPVLAKAMQSAGCKMGMLLDINNYWVHFAAIHSRGGAFEAEPLYPDDMSQHADRYLWAYTRDYFYVVSR